jgi:hypothetical protein
MKALLLVALVMLVQPVSAIDARDARGLAVAIEPIAEPLIIDGLVMHVVRAQGAQVSELARRIEERWRQDQGVVLPSQHGEWRIRSRWAGLRTEVIQWRGEGAAAELLFSWFDASRRPEAPARDPMRLPSLCQWTRRVEGQPSPGRFVQQIARCRIGVEGLLSRLEPLLSRHEWRVLHRSGASWELMRLRETARATVVAGASPEESALVWITTTPGERP